jgi:hypothetical protein
LHIEWCARYVNWHSEQKEISTFLFVLFFTGLSKNICWQVPGSDAPLKYCPHRTYKTLFQYETFAIRRRSLN